MIGLIQRVTSASVVVDSESVGRIENGLMVLVGVEADDDAVRSQKLAHRLLGYRIFADAEDKMNLSVRDIGGEVLLVPQFTLVADTSRGMRPSFSSAAPPTLGSQLFDSLVDIMSAELPGRIQTGRFGADMAVSLVNDGPVTFWLQT